MTSSSASNEIVSVGGPVSRSASPASLVSPLAPRACVLRVSVSGLYWNVIVRTTASVAPSSTTRPARAVRGLREKPVTAPP